MWKDDKRDGYGTYTYANGDTYAGEWKAGAKAGKGTYTAKASSTSGQWKDDALASGNWALPNGSYYSSEYAGTGKPQGLGYWYHASGTKQVGTYSAYVAATEDEPASGGVFTPLSGGTPADARPATFEQTLTAAGPGDLVPGPTAECTYAMIKPNAVAAGATGAIIAAARADGFTVVGQQEATLSVEEAELFYAEHQGKSFFGDLVSFMTSGPIVKLILQKEGAILGWRALLGPTNSLTAKAEAPTSLRALYGIDGTQNAAHGSDSPESAAREIELMFPRQSTLVVLAPHADDEAGAGVEFCLQALRSQADAVGAGRHDADKGFVVSATRTSITAAEATTLGGAVAALVAAPEEGAEEDAEAALPDVAVTALVCEARGGISAANACLAMCSSQVKLCYSSADAAAAAADIDLLFPVQKTCCIIKPDAAGSKAAIVSSLADAGLTVLEEVEETMAAAKVSVLYQEHKGKDFEEELVEHMSSGGSTLLLLEGRGAVLGLRTLIGPTDPEAARDLESESYAPACLRAKYGTSTKENAVHASKDAAAALREADILFPTKLGADEEGAKVEQTYAMIKPNAVDYADEICLLAENHGFTIVKKEAVEALDAELVKSFYAEHEGKEFFDSLVEFMTSGPVVKLMLERPNAIKAWRAMLGPTNPLKAAEEAPSSIRARFGNMENGTQNAGHGSDAPESAAREIALMFPPEPEGEPEP
jgi:nucleoside diphosphate kinase